MGEYKTVEVSKIGFPEIEPHFRRISNKNFFLLLKQVI